MKQRSSNHQTWWMQPRVVAMAVLILAVGYVLAKPGLERWLSLSLPSLVEEQQPGDSDTPGRESASPNPGDFAKKNGSAPSTPSGKQPSLRKTGPDTFQSPAGLVYAMGPGGQHRIDHILLHTRDDASRPVHGVFEPGDRETVLGLLDQALTMIEDKSADVRSARQGQRTEYTIDMPGVIGFVGGKDGKRDHFPRTRRLKLVLEGRQVITAYPVWPGR